MAVYSQKRVEMLKQQESRLAATSQLPPLNPNFVGREVDLVALEESFEEGRPLIIGAQVGLGGIGKTQIALQYAQRNTFRYNFIWVFNAESASALILSYTQFAIRHNIPIGQEQGEQANDDLIETVHRWLRDHPGWLLIYDDAANQNAIRKFLPGSGGHILITSRTTQWTEAKVFKVGLFKKHESVELLLKITHLEDQKEDAALLADLLENLPLAIDKAACFIRETGMSFAEYIQKYQQKSRELWKAEQPGDDKYKFKVSVAWTLSMNEIRRLESIEREKNSTPTLVDPLMQLCSFFSSAPIPRFFLEAWISQFFGIDTPMGVLTRTIRLLSSFSMIDTVPNNISLHAVVQTVTRDCLENSEQKRICSQVLTLFYRNFLFNEADIESIKQKTPLVVHAERAVAHTWDLQMEEEDAMHILDCAAHYLIYNGGFSHALEIWNRCLSKNPHWYEGRLIPATRTNIGNTYQELGQYEKAQEQFNLALAFYVQSGDRFGILKCQLHLALILKNSGQTEAALQKLIEVSTLWNETPPTDEIRNDLFKMKGIIENNLGNVLLALGRPLEARTHLLAALKIFKQIYPPNHPDIANPRNGLGNVYKFTGEYIKAKKQFTKALRIKCVAYPSNHPSIAKAKASLGGILLTLGDYSDAKAQFLEAIKIFCEASLGNHPIMATIRASFCQVLLKTKEYKEARQEIQKALDITSVYTPDNPKTADIKISLSECLIIEGDYQSAENILREALSILRNDTATHPLSIVQIRKNLGIVYRELNRFEQSFNQLKTGLETCANYPIVGPITVAEIQYEMGRLFQNLNEYSKALKAFEFALNLYQKHTSEYHISIANCRTEKGICLKNLRKYPEALVEYEEALRIIEHVFSPKHVETIEVRFNLGNLLGRMGRYQEGEVQFNKVFEIMDQSPIKKVSDLAKYRRNFALLYLRAEDYEKAKNQLVIALEFGDAVPIDIRIPCMKMLQLVQNLLNTPVEQRKMLAMMVQMQLA